MVASKAALAPPASGAAIVARARARLALPPGGCLPDRAAPLQLPRRGPGRRLRPRRRIWASTGAATALVESDNCPERPPPPRQAFASRSAGCLCPRRRAASPRQLQPRARQAVALPRPGFLILPCTPQSPGLSHPVPQASLPPPQQMAPPPLLDLPIERPPPSSTRDLLQPPGGLPFSRPHPVSPSRRRREQQPYQQEFQR